MEGKQTKLIISSNDKKMLLPHLKRLLNKEIIENDCNPKICSFTIINTN